MSTGPRWIDVWHVGRKLRGASFSLAFLKSGEGMGLLGPGIYFASSPQLAAIYAKYHIEPWLYRCRIDAARVMTTRGEPAHLLAATRRAVAAEEQATGREIVYPWDSLVYGRGLVGYLHKRYGAKQAAERMTSIGIIGHSEELPSGDTEFCVWDVDAIEIVEAAPYTPAQRNPLALAGSRARILSGGAGMKKLVSGGGWRKRVATDKTTKPFVAYHLDKDGKQCWYACDTMLEARRVAAGGPDKQPTCRCEQVGHYTTTCKVHGTPALKPVANPGGKKQRRAVAAAGPLWRMGDLDHPPFSGGVRSAEASVRKARAARLHEESVGIGVKALPNPSGKKGFAVVQFKGMEEAVLSVHSTQSAAQSAMRVKEGKSGRMDLRVQAFGPGTGRELVTGMGGRFLRHTIARNPSAREHMARGNYDLLRAQSLQMHAADRMRGEPRQARAYGHAAAMAARAELDLQDAHATGKASEARKLYDESLASLEAFKRTNPGGKPCGFKVGDIVCFKASHLKSLQWHTNVPINGKVTKLEKDKHAHLYPDRWEDDPSAAFIATVKWHDRTAGRVLCSNLIKYNQRHRELP